jgi:hypothetical protein
MSYMRYQEHGDGSWWYYKYDAEDAPIITQYDDWTESWVLADVLPRHLWRFGLVEIDSSNRPSGWTSGTIIGEDWLYDGKGDFNHMQYVVDTTRDPNGVREPLIANSSSEGSNYGRMRWSRVKERINSAHAEDGWSRIPLPVVHTVAGPNEKKHDPANLYTEDGVFRG